MTRGGSGPPWATLRSAPILRSAIFFSSRISTERPASLAMASAFSARMRGESAFGDGLGGFFAGVALSNEESEGLDRASLQIAQGGGSDLAKRGAIPLLALPCSDEQQTRGLETGGRVDEREFQSLASQFAALSKFLQEAPRGFV